MANDNPQFSMQARLKSFRYAFSGLKSLLIAEHNSRIHLAFTLLTILSSVIFKLSHTEILVLTIVLSLVWMAELFNTCIEKIVDFISLEKLPALKIIKDLAAAAVLVSAGCAIIIGCLIFIPKII